MWAKKQILPRDELVSVKKLSLYWGFLKLRIKHNVKRRERHFIDCPEKKRSVSLNVCEECQHFGGYSKYNRKQGKYYDWVQGSIKCQFPRSNVLKTLRKISELIDTGKPLSKTDVLKLMEPLTPNEKDLLIRNLMTKNEFKDLFLSVLGLRDEPETDKEVSP